MKSGCLPIRYDPRDKNFTKMKFGATTLSMPVLGKTLGRIRRAAKDQAWSLSCTQQAINGASEYQDKEELCPAWSWSRYCKKVGNFIPDGADPREAMMIAIQEGLLPQRFAPLSFPKDDPQVIGNWNNWPELHDKAEPYKKAAYVQIPFVRDHFDSVRSALKRMENDGTCVLAASGWYDSWIAARIPNRGGNLTGYHMYFFMDYDTIDGVEYLVAQNSYGANKYDKGFQYFPREVVNREFAQYGCGLYFLVDMTPEQIALARLDTPLGRIQRQIIRAWEFFMLIAKQYARIH